MKLFGCRQIGSLGHKLLGLIFSTIFQRHVVFKWCHIKVCFNQSRRQISGFIIFNPIMLPEILFCTSINKMGEVISCPPNQMTKTFHNSSIIKSQSLYKTGEENLLQTQDDACGLNGKFPTSKLVVKERIFPESQPFRAPTKKTLKTVKTKKLIGISEEELMSELKKSCKKIKQGKSCTNQTSDNLKGAQYNFLTGLNIYTNIVEANLPIQKEIKINGENFFRVRKQPITPFYNFTEKIGEGAFGSVYQALCCQTGQKRAIKVLKMKLMNSEDLESFTNEVNILKQMDHINIIKIYDIFCYQNFFYVVTEFCAGGSLLEAFKKDLLKSERTIKIVMRQVFSALFYMHRKCIAHRDIKLENIVLVNSFKKGEDHQVHVKLIDFGLAEKAVHRVNKCGLVGTPSYIAPEVLKGSFGIGSDVWSCGIVLCILLTGRNPFKDRLQEQTFKNILNKPINFQQDPLFNGLNEYPRDLLFKMLTRRLEQRISIRDCLRHPFIEQPTMLSPIDMRYKEEVVTSISNFTRGSNFVCLIKNFLISKKSSQEYREEMARIFQEIDLDGSGMIDKEELVALYKVVSGASAEEAEKHLQRLDSNKSAQIDFSQFLLAMSDNSLLQNKGYLRQAFQFFDTDHTGFIDKKELMESLEGCQQQDVNTLINLIDINGDGKISLQQFCKYMLQLEI